MCLIDILLCVFTFFGEIFGRGLERGSGFHKIIQRSSSPVGKYKERVLRKQLKFGAQMLILENRENEGSRCWSIFAERRLWCYSRRDALLSPFWGWWHGPSVWTRVKYILLRKSSAFYLFKTLKSNRACTHILPIFKKYKVI